MTGAFDFDRWLRERRAQMDREFLTGRAGAEPHSFVRELYRGTKLEAVSGRSAGRAAARRIADRIARGDDGADLLRAVLRRTRDRTGVVPPLSVAIDAVVRERRAFRRRLFGANELDDRRKARAAVRSVAATTRRRKHGRATRTAP